MRHHRGDFICPFSCVYSSCSYSLLRCYYFHFFQGCLANRFFLKLEAIIQWLENHQLVCFYKSTFGIECPGCGTQRAFILLLRCEFLESFFTYPPLIFFLSLMLFLILHLIFKFRKGGTYLMYLFLFTALIVMINFICRLINHG